MQWLENAGLEAKNETSPKEAPMKTLNVVLGCVVAAAGLLAGAATEASAEDVLKLAVGQRGNWDTSVSEIGQRGGIFKKHGLALAELIRIPPR